MSDDDTIELTNVVKTGNVPEQQPAPQQDFGANLDALLMDLDGAGAKASPVRAMPETGDLGTKPADGHVVNPNEEINLPSLSDLDALLEELGVEDAPRQKAVTPEPAAKFDELDAENPADAASAAPAVLARAEAPQGRTDVDIESILEDAAAAIAPARPATVAAPLDDDGGIDLNRLDSMLDQVLSAAPKKSAPPAPASAPASDPVPPATDPLDLPDDEPQAATTDLVPPPIDIDVAALLAEADAKQIAATPKPTGQAYGQAAASQAGEADEDDILELDMSAVTVAGAAPQFSAVAAGPAFEPVAEPVSDPLTGPAAEPSMPATPAAGTGSAISPVLAGRLEQLETQLQSFKAENAGLRERLAALDGQLATGAAENTELKVQLDLVRADLDDLRGNIEKYAAQAAAKVIREEVAALSASLE